MELDNKQVEAGLAAQILGVSVTALKSSVRMGNSLNGINPPPVFKTMRSGSTFKYFFLLGDLNAWKNELNRSHNLQEKE